MNGLKIVKDWLKLDNGYSDYISINKDEIYKFYENNRTVNPYILQITEDQHNPYTDYVSIPVYLLWELEQELLQY